MFEQVRMADMQGERKEILGLEFGEHCNCMVAQMMKEMNYFLRTGLIRRVSVAQQLFLNSNPKEVERIWGVTGVCATHDQKKLEDVGWVVCQGRRRPPCCGFSKPRFDEITKELWLGMEPSSMKAQLLRIKLRIEDQLKNEEEGWTKNLNVVAHEVLKG